MKYDRLGINGSFAVRIGLQPRLMPEPSRLLPLLEQISNDSKFVEIARQRARNLADASAAAIRTRTIIWSCFIHNFVRPYE